MSSTDRSVASPQDFVSRRCSSDVMTPSPTRDRNSGSRSQSKTSRGLQRRPPGRGEVDEGLVGEHLVVERLAAPFAAPLAADLAPHRVEERVGDPGQLAVAPALGHQLAAERPELAAIEQDRVVAPEDPELLRTAGRLLTRRTANQLGDPLRALDVGHRGLVVAGRAHPVDDLAEGAQRDGGLTQAREHPLDVAHEDAARPDDEDAAAFVAASVGVEQVGGAVQRDHGLAGAGPAGDRHDTLAGRPDRLVLLGLDGGDDGVHGPVAGAGELGDQRALADDRQVRLQPRHRAARPRPRPPAARRSAAPVDG